MTELEKIIEELCEREAQWCHCSGLVCNGCESANKELIKIGFKEALKPEHMKHTEEVKGLIEILRFIKNDPEDATIMGCRIAVNEALKPFEKEGSGE